jgi:murein DD-endopeptidase MepM/ murein hydrolase activator NlpD
VPSDRVGRGLRSLATASRLGPARRPRAQARPQRVALRRPVVGRLGPDRAVAVAVAGVLLGASLVSVAAGGPAPNTGGTDGAGTAPRIAIGGPAGGPSEYDYAYGGALAARSGGSIEFGSPDPTGLDGAQFAAINPDPGRADVEGPFIDDGTLIKPIAVDTSVPDGSDLVTTYKVKSGDTLVGIAQKFGVSMMSLWWANDLKSKDDLHIGQVLDIPPVTGLIVTVTAADTLESLADEYNVNGEDILVTNGVEDPNLVVGQVLVIPGAKGDPIPTPKPKPKPKPRSTAPPSGGGGHTKPPSHYSGGKMLWPVVGGHNYISQYFHTGHYALDIAADYGTTVRAASSGTVIFAGWKNNGGGYQVWIAHGSGLYTTYNHMSAISVGHGQHVGRGQQVGRVGQSGWATGPHLHFEVWRGPVWAGGTRVNPLIYL